MSIENILLPNAEKYWTSPHMVTSHPPVNWTSDWEQSEPTADGPEVPISERQPGNCARPKAQVSVCQEACRGFDRWLLVTHFVGRDSDEIGPCRGFAARRGRILPVSNDSRAGVHVSGCDTVSQSWPFVDLPTSVSSAAL